MEQQLFRNSSTARAELFAKLKPCCVEISKLAMGQQEEPSTRLLRLTDQLYSILESQANKDASALDPKIAEYVFFPLSFIFKNKEKHAARVVENSIKILRILIQHGWRSTLSTSLVQQLLILLTFIVAGVPGQPRSLRPPEETVLECYRCLAVLIRAACLSTSVSASLVDSSGLPSLGHAVTVILDGVTDGTTAEQQIAALDAVRALFATMKDRAALASFLPGSVSTLSKLLAPPPSLKLQKRVIVYGLQVLRDVLVRVLGDLHNREALRQLASEAVKEAEHGETDGKELSASWLKATAAQVKLALAMVLKLRNHDSEDVRAAVEKLSLALLDECHATLAECALFLVETAIVTAKKDHEAPKGLSALTGPGSAMNIGTPLSLDSIDVQTTLHDLAVIYPELQNTIKAVVHNMIISLPRVMQSADESVKQQCMKSLAQGQQMLEALHIDSSQLHEALSSALRDSIVVLASSTKKQGAMAEVGLEADVEWEPDTTVANKDEGQEVFKPVMLPHGGQKKTRDVLLALVGTVGSPSHQANMAAEMVQLARDSLGIDQVAAFWLSFELLKAALDKKQEFDEFFDFSVAAGSANEPEDVFQELYQFSVSVLASHSDSEDVDWRLEAIGIEVASFAACRMGPSFRPELIDTLYPITTFLGSQNAQLRIHAMTALKLVASACGYRDVSELIIDNADYMINSVSLRINSLDITPASLQVLRMIIRLTGPSLLPFLDDTVAAVFSALDNYHGYPVFVEKLFVVLSEVVQQGVGSDRLLVEPAGSMSLDRHKKRPLPATTIADIELEVSKRCAKRQKRKLEDEEELSGTSVKHPQAPWKSEARDLLDKREKDRERGEYGDDEADENGGQDTEKQKPPPTPTYALLSRVAQLTQYYLTSPAPTLRKSLLDLVATATPAMAMDEDAFLPLVNSLWPVIMARLYDGEPYVAMAACGAIGALAQGAGDFLATRVKTEWWERLSKWCRKVKGEAGTAAARGEAGGADARQSLQKLGGRSSSTSHLNMALVGDEIVLPHRAGAKPPWSTEGLGGQVGLGRFAQAAQVWEAAVGLLVALVSYVGLEEEIFEEILELLAEKLRDDAEVREALEVVNADAVWLAMYERGMVGQELEQPMLGGAEFALMRGTTS